MAQTYNRRINLYININGKEIKNDIKSIKGELQLLINQQAKMTIGSQEYVAHAAKINQLKDIVKNHNAQLNQTTSSWLNLGKAADKFNKYFGMVGAALASFAGVSLAIKSAIDAFNKFDDKVADVMKTTGLTKDQVLALNEQLKKIDTRTSQQELLDLARVAGKLGISAEQDVLGFVRAADKIRVALTEDLGGDVEESINQLGKLTDIFGLTKKFGIEDALIKVGSAINSLGAAGTANEAYLVEFAKRVAGIAPSAGVSIENILGLGATLDELGQTSEVAGTVYSQVMGGMFKDTATYANIAQMSLQDFTTLMNTDANEAFIKVLEGAKGSGTGFGEMAQNLDALGLDGARATSVLGVLADNTDKLREKQKFSNDEFALGTSLIKEFNTKNETAQAQLEKAKKGFTDLQVELGEKLAPAYTSIISKSSAILRLISATVDFMYKYGKQIIITASAIAGYTIAVKVAANWTKIQTAYTVTATAVEKAYGIMKSLLTGKITLATVAQKAWNVALKANPIGLIVGILAGAITWLVQWNQKTGKVSEALAVAGDKVRELANWFIELYNSSKPVRAAIQALVVGIKTGFEIATFAVKSFWEQLKLGGKLLKAVLTFDVKGIKDAFTDFGTNIKENAIESARDIGTAWSGALNETANGEIKLIPKVKVNEEGFTEAEAAMRKKKGSAGTVSTGKPLDFGNLEDEESTDFQTVPNVPSATGSSSGSGKGAKKTPEQIAKEELDKKLKAVEDANKIEVSAITRRYAEQKTTETQYRSELLSQELKYLTDKMAMYDKSSAEYADLETAYNEKSIAAREEVNKLLKEAEKELADFQVETLEEGISKEKQLEENRWNEELAALQNRLIEKEKLSADEVALNDAVNNLIEQKQAEHLNRMNELTTADNLKLQMDKALIQEAEAETDQKRFEARRALTKAQYDQDVANAKGNAVKIAQAQRNLSNTLVDIKTDELEATRVISDAKIQLAIDALGTLTSLVGEETKLGKALFLMQQAAAIGQVIFNTAVANAKAVNASPFTAGMPWVAINTARAAISIAGIVAQSIQKFSGGKKSKEKGFYEGGYTPSGPANKPVGTVHAGEWVAPKEMVESPQTRPVIQALEEVRKDKNFKSQDIDIPGYVSENKITETTTNIIQADKQDLPSAKERETVIDKSEKSSKESVIAVTTDEREVSTVVENSLSDGGYTPEGPVNTPVGTVHSGEWVAPQWMTKSSVTGPWIKSLEDVRLNSMEPVNVKAITYVGRRGYAEGGYVSNATTQNVPTIQAAQSSQSSTDEELKELLRRNNEVMEKLLNWKPKVYTEMIKKDLDTLDSINRNRNM